MIDLSTALKHYNREEVKAEIVRLSANKEVVGSYGGKGYGKRPDIIQYPNDILELVRQGVTSFHCSEEIWKSPLQLSTDMHRKDIEELRTGWDLVIDIDCPYWEYSKLITHLVIKAFKRHGIKSISCKFSGNKGFHIAIPFRAFPEKVHGKETKLLFPDGLRRVALYLMHYIDSPETGYEFSNEILKKTSIDDFAKLLGKDVAEIMKTVCIGCGSKINITKNKVEFVCSQCGKIEIGSEDDRVKICEQCKKIMERHEIGSEDKCKKCGKTKFQEKFDPSLIIDIDTVLISSRHLYRMCYSLHEKSGLVSIPVEIDKVLEFEKEQAKPQNIKFDIKFLDGAGIMVGEGRNLIIQAFDFKPVMEEVEEEKKVYGSFEDFQNAIPEDFFPPCIKKALNGMEDGKKRFLFVLINFLTCSGWSYDKIDELIKEWNPKNKERLRQVYIKGQLNSSKMKKEKIPPPNCPIGQEPGNYYCDLQICTPDPLCGKIKNPVQYAKRKTYYLRKDKKKK